MPDILHLLFVIQVLHRMVVKGIAFLIGSLAGPDERFGRVLKARSAKVGHGVRLVPDNIVQYPVAQVEQNRPNTEDTMVRSDNPERAIVFEHTPTCLEPGARKRIVFGKTAEAIPCISNAIDDALVGAQQLVAQLQMVGWVGKIRSTDCGGSVCKTSRQSP